MARHFSRLACGFLLATVVCSTLTGCVAYPVGPYGAVYPVYGPPRPAYYAGGYGGWGWHHWR